MRVTLPIVALGLLSLAACATGPDPAAPPPPWHEALDDRVAGPTSSPIAAHLPAALARLEASEQPALAAFYRDRDYAPLWYDDGPLSPLRAEAAPRLDRPVSAVPADDVAGRVVDELALTRAAIAFDGTATPGLDAALDALAAAVARTAPVIDPASSFAGQDIGIARYEAIVAAGGWPTVPDGPTLEPGDVDPRVALLRRRLQVSSDLADDADDAAAGEPQRFDVALVAAVERFQARHGLAVDGVVGPATRRALNVPAAQRLAQLRRAAVEVNALQRGLEQRYVLVNVPAFELRYVDAGAVTFRTEVIVGSRDDPTVIFSDRIEHLVFNPYWHVPRSIAREELIHDFKADAASMATRGFQVVDAGGTTLAPTAVDWAAIEPQALPYRFRQGPGAGNALGRVKFMFPNDHAIYLHDTPTKSLFDRSMRALSHGCVRVRDPMVLAERLLASEGHDREDIDRWLSDERNHHVHLREPVPVHLVYVTAWADADGTVHFRPDVYGRG